MNGVPMKTIFLIGAERSGTTVLRLMLNAHPLISWLNEFEYSVDMLTDDESWPDKDEYLLYLSTHRIFQATNLIIDKSLNYPELIKSFLAQKQQRDNKPIVGATCHRHYDRLLRIFPQARFIYLLRDPRDVARSNIGMGWAGNVWYGVNQWIEAEELWEDVKRGLDKTSYIEIKYENLIADSKNVLTRLCRFLNVMYDEEMLSYPKNTTYSLPDTTFIEQWKRKMTKKEIQLVEFKAENMMRLREYQIYSDVLKEPSSIERLFLFYQNRWFKIKFRMKLYGFWIVIADVIARRFNIKPLMRNVKMRFNRKTNMYLK